MGLVIVDQVAVEVAFSVVAASFSSSAGFSSVLVTGDVATTSFAGVEVSSVRVSVAFSSAAGAVAESVD